jgi:guanylate kinase
MMRFSISATTRERRPNEVEGVDYYFLTPEQFRAKIENQEFLEWEEVYKDRYYGTLKSEVQRILDNDNVALFDVDVEGGLNIKRQYGRQLFDVFVMPPSVDELHRRLVSRATESEESLIKRLSKAESELKYAYKFNTVIVNVVLQDAFNEAEKLVREFLEDEIPDSDTQDN